MRAILKAVVLSIVISTISFVFYGCHSKSDETFVPPSGMTPIKTVNFYFEQWNNKNRTGMNSVVRYSMQTPRYGGLSA